MKINAAWTQRYSLFFAWLISLVGVSTSLFFSEILHYQPCQLCWYQRVFLYPLVLILGIAVYRDDRSIRVYVLPLSVVGAFVSLYQYLEQKITSIANLAPCTVGVPCSGHYINWFGFITIPFLSMIAFVFITVLLWLSKE